jgi:hypothetical protein
MKLPSIQQVYLEAKRTAGRFPFVLISAFAAVIAALVILESELLREESVSYPVLLAAGLGLPLLAALALTAEKRKWSSSLSAGSQLLGVLLLTAYALTVPAALPREPAIHGIRFGLLAAGLVFLVMIAPYLKRGELNGFWHYNKTLYFRLFVTAVFSIVLFAGLAIALAALDNLFGVRVPGERYGELWVLVAGLFAPWFFLAGIPDDLDGLDRVEDYPKGLKVFAQYILLSLVIVYLVILYAYLIKILLQWSWPKGWVSSLILGFSATGILSLLLMHPIRDRSGNAWIRTAGKWLYVVLIPLVVVLFLAVTERIGDYGITESRYAGIALGIWLSVQIFHFLFSKAKSIKFTIGSLCLLAFLISFGPWGMLSVSERSQAGRLRKLLVKDGILVNGKVHKEHGKVPQEDVSQISSIVDYLRRIHGYDAIQSWFADKLTQDTRFEHDPNLPAPEVLEKMGLTYVAYRTGAAGRFFNVDARKPADISGYDRVLRQQFLTANTGQQERKVENEGIYYVSSGNLDTLTVGIGDAETGFDIVRVDIGAFAEKLMREFGDADSGVSGSMTPESMALAVDQGGHRVKVFVHRLQLIRRDGKMAISSFTGDIAYTVRK